MRLYFWRWPGLHSFLVLRCNWPRRLTIPAGHFLWEVIAVIDEKDIFLTTVEAMKILRLKKSTFYSYVAQGIIPSHKIGHFLRFKREEIINLGKQQDKVSA